jgi:hypothetical protein
MVSAFWTFATATASPPSAGQMRADATMTTLWVHETDTDGFSRAVGLATITSAHTLLVRAANGTSIDLDVTGTPTDNGAWWTIPVAVIGTAVITKGARTQLNLTNTATSGGGDPAGGTIGQILGKTGSADYAVGWVADQVGAGGGIDTEAAIDAVATALVAGNNIDITYNDPAGTITIDVEALTKADVGLANVDNTSDLTKNAATATLTNKTLTAPVINAPTGLVKADVGLGNVDNTSNATERAAAATLTNKTIALGSNTVSGTLAQFNTAITDADVPAALNGLVAVWAGTQAQYNAIGTKNPNTVYVIV